MNKGMLVGGLVVVVLGGGYAAGTITTGNKVNVEHQRYIEALTASYEGIATVKSSSDASLFSSANTLSIEFNDLPESVVEWAGSNTFNFDIVYTHSFLSSTSVMTIAKGELLSKIQSYQQNTSIAPLTLNNHYSYDIASGSVSMSGDLVTDGFKVTNASGDVLIGDSQGVYSVSGNTIDMNWSMQPSTFKGADFNVEFGTATLVQTASVLKGDILTTKIADTSEGSLVVDSIKLSNEQLKAEIATLLVGVKQVIKADRVVFDVDYQAEMIKIDSDKDVYQLDKPALNLAVDLDLKALLGLIENINELQKTSGGAIEDPTALLPMFNEVTQKGISFDINHLGVSANSELAEGEAHLKMAPFSIEEIMMDRQCVMAKADLDAKLTIPKKFLEVFPNYNPQQIDFFVGMGFLVDAGDTLTVDLTMKKGQLHLNGKQMPMM